MFAQGPKSEAGVESVRSRGEGADFSHKTVFRLLRMQQELCGWCLGPSSCPEPWSRGHAGSPRLPGRDVFIFKNLRALSYPLGTCVE